MIKNIFNKKFFNKTAFTIAIFYCLLSFLWIYYSDKLLLVDPETSLYISTLKGFIYTLVVGFFIYIAISIGFNKKLEAQEKLKESEEKYRQLINSDDQGIALHKIISDKDGNPIDYIILDVNPAYEKLTGLKKENILNKRVLDVLPNLEKYWIDTYGEVARTGKVKHIKEYVKDLNKYYEVTVYSPMPEYFAVIFSDVTDRVKAEDKIKESEEKFRRLFESSKFLIILFDFETNKIIDVNNFIYDFLEYNTDELIGKNILEVESFIDITKYINKITNLNGDKSIESSDLSFKTKSGLMKYGEATSNILFINNRKIIQCYVQDVTEKTELNKAKLDFLSITSHQLRTPLSINKWVLDSIISTDLTDKQREKFNDLIESNERLIVLVNDFLKVALIETGKLTVNKKSVKIKDIINGVVNSLKILSAKKDKEIRINMPSDLDDIYCDPILIHEVLENLVNNAIFYSKENSKEIIINLINRENDYLISVHNEGAIDPIFGRNMETFGKFIRGSVSSETEPTGSGLGLFITKKMVEASGGSVWFESDTKSGTTFYLTIIKNKLSHI